MAMPSRAKSFATKIQIMTIAVRHTIATGRELLRTRQSRREGGRPLNGVKPGQIGRLACLDVRRCRIVVKIHAAAGHCV